jgi:hypothetical protein
MTRMPIKIRCTFLMLVNENLDILSLISYLRESTETFPVRQ